MIDAISIEDNGLLLHSFRPKDVRRLNSMAGDVYAILSDEQTLRFLPGKRIASTDQAEAFLKSSLLSFHNGKNYLHFISDKKSGRVVGMIDLIPPETARQHYALGYYPYFIEFYLGRVYQQRGIMSALLPHFISSLQKKKIGSIAAVANRHNQAACRTLKKAGFVSSEPFDPLQDLYIYTGKTN